MERILLDTSILLLPGLELRDIFSPLERVYEILIPESCINELEAISKGADKKAIAARVALLLIKQKNLKIVSSNHSKADDAILELAIKLNAKIATIDKELKRRAKNKGIPIINIRKNRIMEG